MDISKKKMYILLFAIVLFLIICILLFQDNEQIVFYLNGNSNINIKYGDEYIEEGFVAKSQNGIDLSNNVIISGSVDTNKIGKQEINYILNYKDYNYTITRYIEVVDEVVGYSCKAVKKNIGYEIIVEPNTEIDSYEWNIDGKIINDGNRIKINENIKNMKVTLTKNSGAKGVIDCAVSDEMIYHFKYDINNQKEFIKCNTYNSNDKKELEDKLKRVIAEAGYGTRAGVVEAARFLVGGLDYKIAYLGPKTYNLSLGTYRNIGLNIGKDGWGCNVDGWTQGLDCINYVLWAFYQNGINASPYSNKNNYPVKSVINQIRVGDLLLTPCQDVCNNDFQHVGIIIGIDDYYFYVAESTTGRYNALVVTRHEKNNMPAKGEFSVIKLYNYTSDGNITNMWIE